jgi:hypothetical protein
MTEPPIPGLILAAVLMAGAVGLLSWWFVWRYSRVTWQRTPEGRHLMRLTVVLGLTYSATAVFYFVPLPPIAHALASLALFSVTAAEMWTRITLLHDAQRDHDAED